MLNNLLGFIIVRKKMPHFIPANSDRTLIARLIQGCWLVLTICAALASSYSDPDTFMTRPVIGYAAQSSPPELRAIVGVPGAAVFSEPLPLPDNVTRIRLAPGQSY